jgi:hypothetical protein
MRPTLAFSLMCLIITQSVPAVYAEPDVASQIRALPSGAHIEVKLKTKEKIHGTRGPIADAGFTLLDEKSGERQIPFDQVAYVKQIGPHKSHTTRNVLIVVAVGVAVVGIVLGVELRCGPLGCNSKL